MQNREPEVILVDETDHPIGTMKKQEAHEKGLCHRAFSVFIIRKTDKGIETLLQRRHPDKYHCGGLWTNTCCSHPYPDEDTKAAAERRLYEEMGISTKLNEVGVFHYIANFENGLTENEVDHVFVGEAVQMNFVPNTEEVVDYQWVSLSELEKLAKENPQHYTPWLLPALTFIKP